ncbi:hypothetical protein DKX38_027427 [Salix brachista]|uniref:Glutamate--ammonia ligase n=1 Tax=Salix brachista TaxID=2182728 RepID=A0A5N5JBZ2_9ROSI|nr:hypothetical protein DKX38_027427 [Salix brachista]
MLIGLLFGLLVAILTPSDHTTMVLVLTKPSWMYITRHACMQASTLFVSLEMMPSIKIKELAFPFYHFDRTILVQNHSDLGIANRRASFCVGRDTQKEVKVCFEDRRHASNMDPYFVTSMIAETTILRKPWEPQPTPHMKYCF